MTSMNVGHSTRWSNCRGGHAPGPPGSCAYCYIEPLTVVADAAECRAIALSAMRAHEHAVRTGDGFERMNSPVPGDLVLEVTTAFRWIGHDHAAPGEALGWLLRVEDEVQVLQPIYEPNSEFQWANAKFIVVQPAMTPGQKNPSGGDA